MDQVIGTESGPSTALKTAIERIGSQSALADLLGTQQGTVSKWVRGAKPLPSGPIVAAGELNWVLKVEAATGVSRHDLRPDLYPRDSAPDERTPRDVALDRRPHAGGLVGIGAQR